MTKDYDGDYEYEEAIKPNHLPSKAELTPKSKELAEVCANFNRNLERLWSQWHFALDVAAWSYLLGMAHRAALVSMNHNPLAPLPPERLPEFGELAVDDLMLLLGNQRQENGGPGISSYLLDQGNRRLKTIDRNLMPAFRMAIEGRADEKSVFRIGIEATLASLLVSGWTAFESFLEDLWVCAVDSRPKLFVERLLARGGETKQTIKTIPTESLLALDFDLRTSMGRLLRDPTRFNFKSFDKTRAAYCSAFGPEMKDIFDMYAHKVEVTQALRNLFVHQGGRVDDPFLKKVASDAALRTMKVGQEVIVSGVEVRDRLETLSKWAVAVLRLVDRTILESSPA